MELGAPSDGAAHALACGRCARVEGTLGVELQVIIVGCCGESVELPLLHARARWTSKRRTLRGRGFIKIADLLAQPARWPEGIYNVAALVEQK